MRDTVIIYGTNELTRCFIDWNRDADYWCMNEVGGLAETRADYWAKRVTACFQMHTPRIWRNLKNLNHAINPAINSKGHYDWLQNHRGFPIYMQDKYADVPESVKYPFDEICKKLLPNIYRDNGEAIQFFTSSIAYAIALAIYKDYKRIELIAVEMASDTEYARQKDGVTFWLGIAAGRGIKVILPEKSLLMRDLLYGYTGEIMIERQEFEVMAKRFEEELKKAEIELYNSQGQTTALLNALAVTKSQGDAKRLQKEFMESLNRTQEASFHYGRLGGMLQENRRYLKECDDKIKAAGGEKALAALVGA